MNLTLIPVSGALQLSKELVFLIFLPPLLFEGAINMDLEILRRNWRAVTLLALLGTVLSTFLVGGALHLVVGFTWLAALLIGAILAPTDPVMLLVSDRR